MLKLDNVHARYGQVAVLKGVNMTVAKGETVCLLGANGAGKTSILKCITGGISVVSGKVSFEQQDITSSPGYEVARMKIAHVPENRRVFGDLCVEDNLVLGGVQFFNSKHMLLEKKETIYQLFPRLRERKHQLAGTMSGGEQQMLAIGRGLMMEPKLLILDEPSQGLAPKVVEEIFAVIQRLAKQGMTILLVEQNIYQALEISDRAYVIKNGEILMEGLAKELLAREDIKDAYLH